jgi:hypothetical protein
MAVISVSSDGIRGGESQMVAVSKGEARSSVTVKQLVEAMIAKQAKNHRELCDALVKKSVIQDNKIKEILESMLTQSNVEELVHRIGRQSEAERMRDHSDSLDFHNEIYHRLHLIEQSQFKPLWQRIWNYFFGLEK